MTVPATPAAPPGALARLFRHSLREGRVHPLLHIMRRYWQEASK